MVELPDYTDLAQQVLELARRHGAEQAEVGVQAAYGLSAEVRLGEVDTVEYHRDKGCVVTVYIGKAKGSASTSDFSGSAIETTVAKACALARQTESDPANGLVDPAYLAKEIPDLELDHPVAITPEEAIEKARLCEETARAVDKRITNSEGGEFGWSRSNWVYANSEGFLGGYGGTRYGIASAVVASDGHVMQRDFWHASSRVLEELEEPRAVGQWAGERAVRRLGARPLGTVQTPVIFEAPVATSLLKHLVEAVSGSNLYRQSSFLLDQAGETIFPKEITVREDPQRRKGLGSAPFDGEGVATIPRNLINAGVLTGYCLDSYSARKLGLTPTGHAGGVHNLYMESGDRTPQDLLAEMGSGLLVTELIGQGVNIVTGDYSRGAAGFWVEKGSVVHPVEEITIAGNLRNMYRNLVACGNDLEFRGNINAPSLLISEMTVAGQ